MATEDAYPEHFGLPANPQHPTTTERRPAILDRWRSAGREQARLISVRKRRALANHLRRTAHLAVDRDPIRRRNDVLLHYRAAAVRTELLELAAALERASAPDPDCIAALQALLANASDSPLYNPEIHFSELLTTLEYVRSGL
jgi:hypothetical protein